MTLLSKFCVAFICSGLFLGAGAQEKNSRGREQAPLTASLKEHDFARLQAETEQWLRDYEDNKITGDEFVERMARLHPAHILQKEDAELWIDKYPRSYAANYLLGVFLSRTAFNLTHEYTFKGTGVEKSALFEKYSKLAEDQLLKSAALFSRPYPTYCRLIQVAKDLGSTSKLNYFQRALSIDPKAYEAQAALLLASAPKWGGSIAEVNDVVARSKAHLTSFDGIRKLEALKYEIMGEDAKTKDTEAAIEFYRRSYRTSPAPDTLWRLMEAGEIARQKGYDDRAIDLYGQVLAIEPAHSSARSMRAIVFVNKKKDLKSALADYLVLVKAGDIGAQNALGQIYMDGNLTKADYELAASYFQMAAAQGNATGIMKLRELENRKKPAAPAPASSVADQKAAAAVPARPEPASWVPALEAHDFENLQASADSWLQDYTNNRISGDELIDRMSIFYPSGFFKPRWQKDVELWLEKYPRSYAASYVLGTLLSSTAAKSRGGAPDSATPVQQLADYKAYSRLAEQQFLRSIALFAKPYPSYCALMGLATDNGADFYRRALQVDPKAFKAHSIHLQSLAPKWGGSMAKIDAAIAASKSGAMNSTDKRRLEALAYDIKGDDATMRNDLDAAIGLYRTSYITAPGPTRLWRLFAAADIARKASHTDRAIALYGEIIAIDKANIRALVSRGQMHERVKRDPKAGLADYLVAAAAGDATAQNLVGRMYMDGNGADKNLDLAEAYFRKAEAQGDQYAIGNLQQIAMHRRTKSFGQSLIRASSTVTPSKARE